MPGTKLVPEMNRRPDRGRGDGIAGNDFSLVLHPVDRTDGRGIVGRVGGEGQANVKRTAIRRKRPFGACMGALRCNEPSIGAGPS